MDRMSTTLGRSATAARTPFGPSMYEPDREIIPPHDTRKRRHDTISVPFRYVCQLVWDDHGIRATGTGTLIGPRTVLTVGHNLVDERGGTEPLIVPTHSVVVYPGLDGTFAPFPTSQAQRFVFFPGYVLQNSEGKILSFRNSTRLDLAIVQLEEPIGDMVGFWGEQPRPSDDSLGSIIDGRLPVSPDKLKVNLSGYPGDKPDGTQWSTFNRLDQLKNGLLLYENDTAIGHSGSPVWIKRIRGRGGRVMIGVHVRRFRIDGHPAFNAAIHLDEEKIDFIRRNTL